MNMSQTSQTINHNDPIQISCTQKCHDAMVSDKALKGRARQYCMLISRNDELSQKASEQMRGKVNLAKLIANGYVEINAQTEGEVQTTAPVFATGSIKQQGSSIASKRPQIDNQTAKKRPNQQVAATPPRKAAISTHRIKPLRQMTDSSLASVEQRGKFNCVEQRPHDANPISPILQFATGQF